MESLIFYDSTRPDTVASAAQALVKYPKSTYSPTYKDLAGMTATEINTYIGTLSASTYAAIVSGCAATRVEEALGTAVITLTAGAANEIGYIQVANAGGDILLSVGYTTDASTDTADAVIVKDIINDGTALHGFSADNALGVVTITAPAGSGATANTYVTTADADTGGTLAIVITSDFAATATGVTAVGSLGDFTEEDFIDLVAKIDATAAPVVTTGTATAGGATTIDLAAGSSTEDDYYNGMTIYITTGTGDNQVREITDYNGTTLQATVATWGTNPDNTSVYAIRDDLLAFGQDIGGVTSYAHAWDIMFPTKTEPRIIGLYNSSEVQATGTADAGTYHATMTTAGTATSATATTLVDAGRSWGTDTWIGYYIKIMSGTGAGQVREITDSDGTSVTVATWTTNPDATSTYQIYNRNQLYDAAAGLTIDANIDMYIGIVSGTGAGQIRKITDNTTVLVTVNTNWSVQPYSDSVWQIATGEDYLFNNLYMQYAIKAKMSDFDNDDCLERWYKVLDRSMVAENAYNKKYQSITNRTTPLQDLEYLAELREVGKSIYEYSL